MEDILDQEFKSAPSQFTFGYIKGTTWFKIELTNDSKNSDFVLYFTEPLWEEFDLYQDVNGTWKVQKAGLLVPVDQREINDVNPAFSLHIPSGTTQTFYIKGKTVSAQLGAFQIFTQKEFFRPTRFSGTDLYLFYIIFLLLAAFFNIYLYIAQREKIYAFYIMYIFTLAAWISIKSGVYLIFGFSAWNDGLHAAGTLTVLLLTLFSSEFLELKKRLPSIHRIFNLFALGFGLLGIAITLKVPYTPFIFNIISSIFFTLLLVTSIKVWREGHLKMRYYLIALIIYMPTLGMLTLTFNGFIDNYNLTRYAFVFGSFTEVLFFNSLMVSRYHALFQDKIDIQTELILEKEKTEALLEEEILQQSQELKETREQLAMESAIDPQTQLYSKQYAISIANRAFDAALRYDNSVSIVILKLENFQMITDTYGYTISNEMIIKCSHILQELVRSSDILARYAQDQFIIIATHSLEDEISSLADRIQKRTKAEKFDVDKTLHFTLNIGIAHLHKEDITLEQLILRAKTSLNMGKA